MRTSSNTTGNMKNSFVSLVALTGLFLLFSSYQFFGYQLFSDGLHLDREWSPVLAYTLGICIALGAYVWVRVGKSDHKMPVGAFLMLLLYLILFYKVFSVVLKFSLQQLWAPLGPKPQDQIAESASTWGMIVVICLLAPLLEELFFRGVLLSAAIRIGGSKILALIVSSLFFGLIHLWFWHPLQSIPHILDTTMIGFVFGYLYLETRNIILPIILHIALGMMSFMW